jgi:hypothetical protein
MEAAIRPQAELVLGNDRSQDEEGRDREVPKSVRSQVHQVPPSARDRAQAVGQLGPETRLPLPGYPGDLQEGQRDGADDEGRSVYGKDPAGPDHGDQQAGDSRTTHL